MKFLRGKRGKTLSRVQILVSGVKHEVMLTSKEIDSLINAWNEALASIQGDGISHTVTFEIYDQKKMVNKIIVDLRQVAAIAI